MKVFAKRGAIIAVLAGIWLTVGGSSVHAEFTTENGWNDQLFPSYIVATATIRVPEEALEEQDEPQVLGDRQGLLGVTLEAPEDETPVTVTITCDAIMEPSTFTGVLPEGGTSYTIYPKVKFKYDALVKNRQAGPITVTFDVEVDDEEAEQQTHTLTLRSVNDCPFTIVEDGDAVDVSFMFAAYVNEQHPYVDKILREALNHRLVDSFTGYQSGDKVEVYRQVYSLWNALSKRDLRYSDITTTSAESDHVNSQHVRLIGESINNAQANCVDGSVLLASLMRKIGIEPVLVMVPGHCYLGFYLDREGKEIAGLETTLLGSSAGGDATVITGLSDEINQEWMSQNSWKTFAAALAIGSADMQKNAENFKSDADPNYQLIPVIAARKLGVLPIAFQSSDQFVTTAKDNAEESEEEEASEE